MKLASDRSHTSRVRTSLSLVLIVAAVALVYGQVFRHDFINFDDPLYLNGNSYSIEGLTWDGVWWAWYNLDAANWHPLTWLSHMADCAVFGIGNPGLHILENAGWHLLNSFLVYWFLRRLIAAEWAVLAGALFFAVHPVNVEAVAWASQRKSLLNLFLMLVALHGYLDYVAKPSFRRYAVSLLAFALSLTAKSMSVTLPVLLLLLDCWPLQRVRWPAERPVNATSGWALPINWRRLLLEKVPFMAISVWLSILTIWAQVSIGAAPSVDHFGLGQRLMNTAASYGAYFYNALVPTSIGVFYPMRDFSQPERYLVDLALAALLLALTVWAVGRRQRVAVGLLWYWVTLLPVIGLLQVGGQAMADRYFYLPGIGVVLAAVSIDWARLLGRWHKPLSTLLLPGYLCVLTAFAYSQTMLWRNGNLLYEDTMETLGRSWHLSGNLGATYYSYGQFEKALAAFDKALELYPNDPGLLLNRATVLLVLERNQEALDILKLLEARHLNRPMLQFSLAVAHYKAGELGKADAYVRLARLMMPEERTWQLQIERVRRAIDSPGFMLDHMIPRVCPPAATSAGEPSNALSGSMDLRR